MSSRRSFFASTTRFAYLMAIQLAVFGLSAIAIGCSTVDQPLHVCVATRRAPSQVVISFRTHRGILLTLKLLTPPRATVTNALEIWRDDFRARIWSIERRTGFAVAGITYGEVPDGWTQLYPVEGPPDPLREGQAYAATCGLGRGRFKVTAEAVTNLE